MREYAKIIILLFLLFVFYACSSVKQVPVESKVTIVEKEKLVPVVNPADSANIQALLECDENGKVILAWFNTEKSKNTLLEFKLDSLGNLLAKMKVPPDTIYIKGKETTIEKEIPKIIEVEVEKKLTIWQLIKVKIGGIAIVVSLVFILVFILVKKFK